MLTEVRPGREQQGFHLSEAHEFEESASYDRKNGRGWAGRIEEWLSFMI